MTGDEMIKSRMYAADMNEKLSAAFWAENHKEFLIERAHESFLKLAESMGYTVEKKA